MAEWDAADAIRYWRSTDRNVPVDRSTDVRGLANACRRNAPLLYSGFFDGVQRSAFERLLPRRSGRALDLGCGSGRWIPRLRRAGYTATGIDVQERVVRGNRAMFPDARFDAGDIRELPYDDGAFDLVTAVETLQHLPPSDRVAVYGEVERVLAPEGDLLLIERQRPSPHPHVHAFTDQDWELLDGRFAHVRSVPVMTVPLHRWYERLATRRSPGTAPERMAAATGSPAFYWSAVPVLAVAAPMEPILSRLLPPEQGSYRAALYTAGR